jgi:2-oxo-4-hydroxy-4-carboxy--5-ureidoimidazoline (OHCU) decarboxylase
MKQGWSFEREKVIVNRIEKAIQNKKYKNHEDLVTDMWKVAKVRLKKLIQDDSRNV